MEGRLEGGEVEEVRADDRSALTEATAAWVGSASEGDYLAIQAYLAPSPETTAILQQIRHRLRDRLQVATTLGYGPRFLHSTGQFHKGGPNTGLFLQLVDEPVADLDVPETDYSFGRLIAAQSLGDYQALAARGRRVLRVQLGTNVDLGLASLAEALNV